MQELGLDPETDKTKLLSIGTGGFIKKSDEQQLDELMAKYEFEMKKAIEADKTGKSFIYDMFKYELNNHEYNYTGDIKDTLDCLNLTLEEINNSKNLLCGFEKACRDISNSEV